jgi:hypothetical protein
MEWTGMNGKFLGFVRICSAMAVPIFTKSQNIDVRGRAVIPVYLGYWSVSSGRR